EINLRKFGLKNSLKNQKFFFLGDLIFGLEYIENHCKANKIDFNAHLTHLILHGLLHIIGYDHEIGEKDAKIMEALEIKILKKLKINNPYL
ncbi:MAG: rRNA maturation RNase YbeY, partial [Alphaproteobacteria bacterium]